MKNNVLFLFNPFTKIAGWGALLVGLAIMTITSTVCYYSGVALDGVLDIHQQGSLTWVTAFAYPFLSHLLLVVCTTIVALIFSRDFRVIDLVGTLTLSRLPFLLAACVGLLVQLPDVGQNLSELNSLLQGVDFWVFAVVSLIVIIWTIALIVNAVRISCNFKSGRLAGVVIMGLFTAEMLAKIVLAKLPF